MFLVNAFLAYVNKAHCLYTYKRNQELNRPQMSLKTQIKVVLSA